MVKKGGRRFLRAELTKKRVGLRLSQDNPPFLQFDTSPRSPGVSAKWTAGLGETVGEPVFAPRPDAAGSDAEDAGVIMALVSSPEPGVASYVVVLDAETLHEIARAVLPGHVPLGFHGNFYSDSSPGASLPRASAGGPDHSA